MFKKKDLMIIAVLLIVGVLGLGVVKLMAPKDEGAKVLVHVGKEVVAEYALDKNTTVEVEDYGHNRFVIQDGYVYMEEADCPDQICVNHERIHYDKEIIVCLPHELVLEISGGEENDVDMKTH